MIFDRPLTPEEAGYLRYWKTVCNKCLGWSEADTESWVKEQIEVVDSDLFDHHPCPGAMCHPLESIRRLFVPEHLREKFRRGKLNGLREFYRGLKDVLWLPRSELYDVGFSAEFDWSAVRIKIEHLTETLVSQNRE